MPAIFHTVHNGVTRWDEDDINQLVNDLTGVPGEGKPHDHSEVNTVGWAATERNLDPTNGFIWRALAYDDTEIAAATKDGFRVMGVDIGVQTGDVVGSNVASAASVALPAATDIVPITGTVPITAFTGLVAGARWRLQFASAGCIVRASSSVRINGDYVSRQYGTLEIYSPDGTNVYETARSGRNVGCRLRRTSDASLSDSSLGVDSAISWQQSDWNTGAIWSSGAPTRIVPGIGRWNISGAIGFDDWSTADVRARVYRNGSHYATLFHVRQDTGGSGNGFMPIATVVECTAANDYLEITVSADANLDLKSGSQYTHLTLERAA